MPLPLVCKLVDNYIDKLCKDLNADGYTCLFTPKSNYRKNVPYTHLGTEECLYKSNRKGTELPPYLFEIRDYMYNNHFGVYMEGGEADDGLGIYATAHPECIMVHCDKDIDMIPGLHYNPNKDLSYTISKREGLYNACLQLVKGDSIDHIPSLHKVFGKRVTPKFKEKLHKHIYALTGLAFDDDHNILLLVSAIVNKMVMEMYPDLDEELVDEFIITNLCLVWIHRYESHLEHMGKVYAKKD